MSSWHRTFLKGHIHWWAFPSHDGHRRPLRWAEADRSGNTSYWRILPTELPSRPARQSPQCPAGYCRAAETLGRWQCTECRLLPSLLRFDRKAVQKCAAGTSRTHRKLCPAGKTAPQTDRSWPSCLSSQTLHRPDTSSTAPNKVQTES